MGDKCSVSLIASEGYTTADLWFRVAQYEPPCCSRWGGFFPGHVTSSAMDCRYRAAVNSSGDIPAWRSMDDNVPRASSLWSGTMATRPSA